MKTAGQTRDGQTARRAYSVHRHSRQTSKQPEHKLIFNQNYDKLAYFFLNVELIKSGTILTQILDYLLSTSTIHTIWSNKTENL